MGYILRSGRVFPDLYDIAEHEVVQEQGKPCVDSLIVHVNILLSHWEFSGKRISLILRLLDKGLVYIDPTVAAFRIVPDHFYIAVYGVE